MIGDEAIHADPEQLLGTGWNVDRPGEHEVRDLAQLCDDALVEQALVDRHSVEAIPGEAIEQRSHLAAAPHGCDPTDGEVDEDVEHPPVAGADREPPSGEGALDLGTYEAGKLEAPPFQVEHQLGLVSGRREQLREDEVSASRRSELPAVPVEGQGPDGLEVADLGAPAEQPDVSLDQRDAELLDSTQLLDAVPGAMRHHERRRTGTDDQRAVGDRRPH